MAMVSAVRQGSSLRAVARQFGANLSTVQLWVRRAAEERLDRVDWNDRPTGSRPSANRIGADVEDEVLNIRRELQKNSDLGEHGAEAIRRELVDRNAFRIPSVRTIGRILERRGMLDAKRRIRRPAPPPGWYLPDVARREAEIDAFDIVEDLCIQNGPRVDVLTGISLHGALPFAKPTEASVTTDVAIDGVLERWRQFGLPTYAQFDNDTRFQGAHQYPDVFGRVTRLCLSLDIIPVFTPPRETGFQASIENFNGRWQKKVWSRFHHDSVKALACHSDRFLVAFRRRYAQRIETSPIRRPFPATGVSSTPTLCGRLVYLRRTTDKGTVNFLGHEFHVDNLWVHRLVRCEVNLSAGHIRFFALRRREPTHQPLLSEISYKPISRESDV